MNRNKVRKPEELAKTEKKRPISVRVEADLVNKLDELAESNQVSLTRLVEEAIRAYLDIIEENEDES